MFNERNVCAWAVVPTYARKPRPAHPAHPQLTDNERFNLNALSFHGTYDYVQRSVMNWLIPTGDRLRDRQLITLLESDNWGKEMTVWGLR